MKEHLLKFGVGAFGTFLLFLFRDVPYLPGLAHVGYWWVRAIFIVTGGVMTIVWQIGDENVLRSLYFGVTWPVLISAVTAP